MRSKAGCHFRDFTIPARSAPPRVAHGFDFIAAFALFELVAKRCSFALAVSFVADRRAIASRAPQPPSASRPKSLTPQQLSMACAKTAPTTRRRMRGSTLMVMTTSPPNAFSLRRRIDRGHDNYNAWNGEPNRDHQAFYRKRAVTHERKAAIRTMCNRKRQARNETFNR